MIVNEYKMTRERFIKWTMPKFYALPIFYIYVCIFIGAILGLWYFIKHNGTKQMILLCIFIAVAIFYLAVFHKWVTAISQYKLLYKKAFKCNCWTQRVEADKDSIKLFVNNELTNTVKWSDIKKVAVAKSSVSLRNNIESDKITLFDDSYVKGSKDEFLSLIKSNFANLPIEKERER